MPPSTTDTVHLVAADDPRTVPLIAELAVEYDTRYGTFFGESASVELARYPKEAFGAPHGAFIVIQRDGETIAGGAFKRFDERTAELKRIWTSSRHRGEGLSIRVVEELEAEAIRRGYDRVYLTTGPRQPEARGLYLRTGYTPLFDPALPAEQVGIHGFAKTLDEKPLDVASIQAAHDASILAIHGADAGRIPASGVPAGEREDAR